MIRRARVLVVAVLAVALAAVGLAVPAGADPDNRVELIRGSGSDTTYGMMALLDKLYNESIGCQNVVGTGTQPLDLTCVVEGPPFDNGGAWFANWDHDTSTEYYPIGSGNGIKMLTNFGQSATARIDFARSSRARGGSDNAGLRFVAFARDGIPWVSFQESGSPALGVSNLSTQQIKDIYINCPGGVSVNNNWSQIGGSSGPIEIWAAQAGSGTRATWDTFLGVTNGSVSCIPGALKDNDPSNGERVVVENNAAPIRDCSSPSCTDHKNAIFYYSYGRHIVSGGEGTTMGSIDTVAPTPTTISNGTYPSARFLYNVYRATFPSNNAISFTTDYVGETGWICKATADHGTNPLTGHSYRTDIESIITNSGFFPVSFGALGGGVAGDGFCRVS